MEVANKNAKFLWVGNAPAIDFINTQIVQQGVTVDLLDDPEDLMEWLGSAGIFQKRMLREATQRLTGPELEAALLRAKEYRKLLRRALQEISQSGKAGRSVITATNRLLAKPRITFAIAETDRRESKRTPQLQEEWLIEEPEDFCRPIAFAFAQLIAEQDLSRIRKCQNPECILFFLDTSKSATRSWCSLNICGNKSRVAAFRERQQREGL